MWGAIGTRKPKGTVRCSRCKEVWLARPEDATELKAPVPAMAQANGPSADAAAEWDALARQGGSDEQETPVVDSPSISADWPASAGGETSSQATDWPQVASDDMHDVGAARTQHQNWIRKLLRPPAHQRATGKPFVSPTTICAAMGALVLGLVIWRVDVVRLLPQTAAFYKMVGFDVNLRGLLF